MFKLATLQALEASQTSIGQEICSRRSTLPRNYRISTIPVAVFLLYSGIYLAESSTRQFSTILKSFCQLVLFEWMTTEKVWEPILSTIFSSTTWSMSFMLASLLHLSDSLVLIMQGLYNIFCKYILSFTE